MAVGLIGLGIVALYAVASFSVLLDIRDNTREIADHLDARDDGEDTP